MTRRHKHQQEQRHNFEILLKTKEEQQLAQAMFEQQHGLSKAFAQAFGIQIIKADSYKITCMGTPSHRSKAKEGFSKLAYQVSGGTYLSKDLINVIAGKETTMAEAKPEAKSSLFNQQAANQNSKSRHKSTGHEFVPKNEHQEHLAQLIEDHDLVFATGPAGTGKTHVAIAKAVQALKNGKVKKILLARPARESGEKIGYLPGDSIDKMAPYMRPLYDEMEKTFGKNYKELIRNGTVEIAPVGFMRGRTFEDSFIIMDEAQNTTIEQIKMALTRIGEGSKMVVTGDPHQIDLEDKTDSGIVFAIERLKNIPEVGIMAFKHGDIVRSHIVSVITDALTGEKDEKIAPKNKKSGPNL